MEAVQLLEEHAEAERRRLLADRDANEVSHSFHTKHTLYVVHMMFIVHICTISTKGRSRLLADRDASEVSSLFLH